MMENTFHGTYLVTGATGGIGRALCHTLSAGGASLVIAGHQDDKLSELSKELGDVPYRSLDACRSAEIDDLIKFAWQQSGKLDGVAHCVGSLMLKPASRTTDAELDDILNLNLKSAFYLVRAAGRAFESQQSSGAIVLVASAAAQHGMPNQEAIAAAKAGVIGLGRSAAATLAPKVRVNVVAPGLIDTPLTEPLTQSPAAAATSAAMFPAQRFGQAVEVAETIAFLLQSRHAFITGQVWGVDGGLVGAHTKPAPSNKPHANTAAGPRQQDSGPHTPGMASAGPAEADQQGRTVSPGPGYGG